MAKKARVQKDDSDSEHDSDSRASSKGAAKKAPEKWNWTAIIIMLMFLLPGAIAVFLQISDIFYPEAKAIREIKERVITCYEVANPAKLSEVDAIIAKYKNNQMALFARLKNKYPKIPQCG